MKTFWNNLPKPFFALAPMADVTDPAFRRIIAKYGKPDVTWTEFVSADGLVHPTGREKLLVDLAYTEAERPIVAQLFSSNPDNMREAARLVAELGYDGIDINMGCPDRTIEAQGCGSAMIKTPERAVEIIRAAREGIALAGKTIPLSLKTRVGYYSETIDEWIPVLLAEKIDALTIHARTRKDLSLVPANWDYVRRVVALRDKLAPDTVILGNGDVRDVAHGRELAEKSGADGVMIGRAVLGNPWIFGDTGAHGKRSAFAMLRDSFAHLALRLFGIKDRYWLRTTTTTPLDVRLRVLIEHATLFSQLLGKAKNFAVMKKHFKAYVHGFVGAKELRVRLMEEGNTAEKVQEIVEEFLLTNK